MPALYCLIGFRAGVENARPWAVAYRVDREGAEQAKTICERQRDSFIKALTPTLEALYGARRELRKLRANRRLSRDAIRRGDEKLITQIKNLQAREAATNTKFAAEMLDPLFPTSTNGTLPEDIEYAVLEFWDDPREMGDVALMKLRAMTHGAYTDDDDAIDDDDDF